MAFKEIYVYCSVKHEYEGDWNGVNTRLSTCDPHAKHLVVNSDSPQEVEANKEIVFTYDVAFEVRLSSRDYQVLCFLVT